MGEGKLRNTRKNGMFVREGRCPCNVNRLFASKFSQVSLKYTDERSRLYCCVFFVFFIIAFVASVVCLIVAVLVYSPEARVPFVLPTIAFGVLVIVFSIYLCCCPSYFERKHCALEVLFTCRSCGSNVHKTYECFINVEHFYTYSSNVVGLGHRRHRHTSRSGQTYASWGRYRNTQTPLVVTGRMSVTNYEHIERKFELMSSGGQQNNFWTSGGWTTAFMSRLE